MQRIRIPAHPGEITPEWLTPILHQSGALSPNVRVTRIVQSDPGSEASYAGYVLRLALEYDQPACEAPVSLIAKFPAPEPQIRYLFRPLYRNEVLFYRRLADDVSLSTPTCYAALLNRRRTRSLLLLQDLTAVGDIGDHDAGCADEQAMLALTRLAEFHATWWQSPELESTEWLGQYHVSSKQNWLLYAGAWLPFQYRLRHITPPASLRLIRNLWRHRKRLRELAQGRPDSLQHGDYRLANMAFSPDEVYVFDWQVIRAGPPLFDVAWFMLTSLTIEQRRLLEADLLRAYHVALIGAGVLGYSFEEMRDDYLLALLLAIPQTMVIGGFLRMDPEREATMATLLSRFEAAREDHDLEKMLTGSFQPHRSG